MTIVCIETSTSVCSADLCKDGVLSKQCINSEVSNHARLLPLYIEELLAFAREQHLVIDAVALSEGPGSYTGLRIGASTAKGLCYGLNIPLIPVPTLEVLCEAAKQKLSTVHCTPYTLIPLLDARRMEVYTLSEDGKARAVVVENEESLYTVHPTPYTIYYFGDGAEKCSKIFTKPNWHYLPGIVPEAQYLGVLAESYTVHRTPYTVHQIAYYEPYYLKEFIAAPSHVKGLS